MVMTGTASERHRTLFRRQPILRACRDASPSRRELVAETGRSRATVYRATVELEEQGLLEERDGGYRTTAKGQALSHVVEDCLTGIVTVDRLDPLFEYVDHPELLSHAPLLADADLTVADEDHIYRANERVLELWGRSDRVRMAAVAPGSRVCLEEGAKTTRENDVDVELCIHSDAIPGREQRESDAFDTSEALACFETSASEAIPFTFMLCDDDVSAIAGHNEVSIPVVLAETDDRRAYQWLENLYETCTANAEPTEAAVA